MAVEARPGPRRPAAPAGPEPLPGWWWPPRVAGWALLLFQFQQGVGTVVGEAFGFLGRETQFTV